MEHSTGENRANEVVAGAGDRPGTGSTDSCILFSLGLMRIVLAFLLISCVTASAASKYNDRMFRRAVIEETTSPFYLLFTLYDAKSGTDQVVCTTANFLLGAIHIEHRLDYDEPGERAARKIALTTPLHRFTFTRRKALENVRRSYSDRVLNDVRRLVARLSPPELKRLNPLTQIYDKRDWELNKAYRDATAHAMLERGVLVYMDDRSGGVYIAQGRSKQTSVCHPRFPLRHGHIELAAADLVSR